MYYLTTGIRVYPGYAGALPPKVYPWKIGYRLDQRF